jgi:transposase
MRQPLTLTRETSVEWIAALMRAEKDARVRDRLRMIRCLAEGQTVPEVARRLSLDETTVRDWLHRYNAEGPEGLRDRPRPGQPPKLAPELVEDFKTRVRAGAREDDPVATLRGPDFQRILETEYGAAYSVGGTYFLLRRLGFSSLVPRPEHPAGDPEARENFKKRASRGR